MAIEQIAWVFKQEIKPSSLKFLLVALANHTNSEGLVYPSVETLIKITNQNRKTVLNGIDELVNRGYLTDTGDRRGRTAKIKVYAFTSRISQQVTASVIKDTVPKTGALETDPKQTRFYHLMVPFLPSNGTVFGESPTPPIKKEPLGNHNGTIKNTRVKEKSLELSLEDWEKNNTASGILRPIDLEDYLKRKKISPEVAGKLVEIFRDKILSKGKKYTDFRATFRVWLAAGWLGMTLEQAQAASIRKSDSIIYNKGLSL